MTATGTYRAYRRVIEPLVSSRGRSVLLLLVVAGLFAGSLFLAASGRVPLKMLPFDNKNELQIVVDLPAGSTLESTDAVVREIEQYLQTVPEVVHFVSSVGEGSPMDFNGLVRHYYLRQSPHMADVRVQLLPRQRRKMSSHAIVLRIRNDMHQLAQRTGETTSMFVRLGFKRVLVQRVEGQNPMRFVLPLGERLPLHVGAGKVLAAAMSEDDLRQMLDELGEIRLANGQPMSREALIAELRRVRQQGYAVSLGERMLGIVAVAAPVMDAKGITIAALSVAGAADRLTSKKVDWLSVEVRDAAKMIAERYDGGSWTNGKS